MDQPFFFFAGAGAGIDGGGASCLISGVGGTGTSTLGSGGTTFAIGGGIGAGSPFWACIEDPQPLNDIPITATNITNQNDLFFIKHSFDWFCLVTHTHQLPTLGNHRINDFSPQSKSRASVLI
jgi:hypothetical protein